MRPWVRALNSTVDSIKHLAECCGVAIGEREMAQKMGMTETEFRACLSGESKVPQKLMADLWPAYEYLLMEQVRANKLRLLRHRVAGLRRMAAKDGVSIADEEIALRAGVTPDTLSGFLDGSIEVPEGLPAVIFEAFRNDLFRNIIVENVTLHDVQHDEHLDLPPEDEL